MSKKVWFILVISVVILASIGFAFFDAFGNSGNSAFMQAKKVNQQATIGI